MNAPTIANNVVSVEVRQQENFVQLKSKAAIAEIGLVPYRLRLQNISNGKTIVRSQPNGLFYERDGITYGVRQVTDVTEFSDGVRLNVLTDEELPATVTLRFKSDRNLEVNFEPPSTVSGEALGERIVSPQSESLYGITECLLPLSNL